MMLVVDIGNTRTKWARVNADGTLQDVEVCFNEDIETSSLKRLAKAAQKITVANVAGEEMAERLHKLAPQNVPVAFMTAQAQACGVTNRYQQSAALGIDRWAAIIAGWQMNKQPSIVVCAGTAITIDALARDGATKNGMFLGGTIMPGMRQLFESLGRTAAQLKPTSEGKMIVFPTSTQDAVQSGCMNAIVGAILLMMQQLEKHSAYLPKLIVSGGDANKIADVLKPHLKRVIIAENLVLQGLVLLESELSQKEAV